MLLLWILLATIAGGLIAVSIASWLAYRVFAKYLHHMVSLSVGVLLSVALLHLLPEAFETAHADARALFALMLAGLIGFFVLEKIALLRHSHHHEGDGHHHHKGHDRHEAGRGGVLILVGSSLHNLADGVLVAAAFLTDPMLGVLTAASIIVHEVPHKLGDFVVLLNAGLARGRAFSLILFTSLCTAAGGVVGYFVLQEAQAAVPYVLVVAASSFLYISVADLMPQMHERVSLADAVPQLLLVGAGVLLIYGVTSFMHHEHDPAHEHGQHATEAADHRH
ncbi:ZIP family metal transporter [Bordetella bronchiseptica]|uniref:ZIP family metal transporter n=1 Tax=Bordetella bronchiseptica TaxID=518 RepID=UPI000459C97B|nr:ZIP family metal transporter [Bordetella bronchiseptica]AZW30552.1 ZIP family metal transporter [Bordetella bronchiseptica]KCV41346.1 metal cation transporter, ZIP domain protein [Bordetella bronchiseptica 345]KDC34988.1 metal cation transporter, ZIP domain protein [Bordetella bronchiseptica GA96-01]KDD14503.1 metal cation transporter, ZIP domain protein [Bordetella bronchiseptica MBORD707]KDD89122.1 metal cation transporter, ZIP domain protein [Bordetella bronchiseptica MO275]